MRLFVLILLLILFQSCSNKTTKEITSFKFDKRLNPLDQDVVCDIIDLRISCFIRNAFDNELYCSFMNYDVDITKLIATFEINGERVFVNNIKQTSALTPNNFTSLVQYKVVAENDSEKIYNISVVKIPCPEVFIEPLDERCGCLGVECCGAD